jgi:aconitate hydratase
VGLPELLARPFGAPRELRLRFARPDGSKGTLDVRVRIDTPQEVLYYRHGGILPFVLRSLLASSKSAVPPGAPIPVA